MGLLNICRQQTCDLFKNSNKFMFLCVKKKNWVNQLISVYIIIHTPCTVLMMIITTKDCVLCLFQSNIHRLEFKSIKFNV